MMPSHLDWTDWDNVFLALVILALWLWLGRCHPERYRLVYLAALSMALLGVFSALHMGLAANMARGASIAFLLLYLVRAYRDRA